METPASQIPSTSNDLQPTQGVRHDRDPCSRFATIFFASTIPFRRARELLSDEHAAGGQCGEPAQPRGHAAFAAGEQRVIHGLRVTGCFAFFQRTRSAFEFEQVIIAQAAGQWREATPPAGLYCQGWWARQGLNL